jgi:glycosyltransferase involved in cell wall biosynthesis
VRSLEPRQSAGRAMSQVKRKKILFVTHTLEGLYGAATSLRLLLENYASIEADLLLPRSFRRPRDLTATAARFPAIRRAYEISMPVDLGLLGIRRDLADTAHGVAHWLGWQRDRGFYRRLLRDNQYDLVHFNSPVLHQMVLPGLPSVMHMRDIIIDHASPVIDRLANGSGIVFIDATTRRPFARREGRMHALTLNNPIDMRAIAQAKRLDDPRLGPATTVFSMIGRVSELKGVALVVEAFRQGAGAADILLVVGAGPENYMAHCRTLAGGDPRIVFWGEEQDVKRVYASTDYVIRGDPKPCIGRTIYEGLYSGCHIIMPGPPEAELIFESDRFGDSIAFYTAGSRDALAQTFAARSGKTVAARDYRSNVGDYVQAFDAFTDSCISRRAAR